MNTKTSYKCAHNFYDGSNHAPVRDGPGALLDMLAEVASRTLRSESIHAEKDSLAKGKRKVDADREVFRNLPRILSMPPTQLVKRFTLFTGDELKRKYSYECTLVPGCCQKYTSFASESRARISITSHLVEHLERLRNDRDSRQWGGTPDPGIIKHGRSKVERSKKHVGQGKHDEIPNKENELADSEKSSVFATEIQSSDLGPEEFGRSEKPEHRLRAGEKQWMELKNESEPPISVLGDHSYYERISEETVAESHALEQENAAQTVTEKIVLMVVESDRVRVEEMPRSPKGDSIASPSPLSERDSRDQTVFLPAKPKGKAKFIGTSKEEREMALILMERIKKRGNPSGSNLQCRICDPPRSFTAPTTLVSHYRSHAGIKPYECRICRSVFTRRHSLKYHMLIHQNETRFTCADCGKKFRHPSHFREHRRRHTGESPFGCDDCGQRFKTRNTYKRHLKTRHGKVLTTSGELLCLSEEEFRKVRTSRKRKLRAASSDYPADEDSTAADTVLGLVDGYRVLTGDSGQEIDGSTVKTERTNIEAGIDEDYEEFGNRILYDGIIGGEEEEEEEEEFVGQEIAMLDELAGCHEGEYEAVKIAYDHETPRSIVVEDNNTFIVPYNEIGTEYYDDESVVDEKTVEASTEPRTKVDEQEVEENRTRLVNLGDEKFSSYRTSNNDDNNNNNDRNDGRSVFSGSAETNESRLDELQRAINSVVEEQSPLIVVTSHEFGTNYLRVDGEDLIVVQQ